MMITTSDAIKDLLDNNFSIDSTHKTYIRAKKKNIYYILRGSNFVDNQDLKNIIDSGKDL